MTAERRDTAGVLIIVGGMALFALVYGFAPERYHGSNEEQFDACAESLDYQYVVRPDWRVAGSERPGLIPRPDSANQLRIVAGRE